MRNIFKSFAAVVAAALLFTSCKKDVQESDPNEISATKLAEIKALGFSTFEAKKIPEGYLVEGDIILTEENLLNKSNSPWLVVAQEEQYRTTNLLNAGKHPTVTVALNNSSANHEAVFSAALDEAIRRYNAESLTFKMARGTVGSSNITVVAYYEASNVLGSAGFPNSAGDPYSQIKMNTYHYSSGTDATNVNYIGTIISHELGHCIGMRHTDYMDRSFSCGGGRSNEEKPFPSGYGAIHISGTPTKADAASWMLACVGRGVNRPFNANDKKALNYIW